MIAGTLPLEGTWSIATRDGRHQAAYAVPGDVHSAFAAARLKQEVDFQVKRLGTHASLALWCGDNELIGALNWFEESRKNRDRYLVSYDRLNRIAEGAIRAADPEACWWPSSPSPGPLSFGDAWHGGRLFAHYRDVKPRFCPEFGFQPVPSLGVAFHVMAETSVSGAFSDNVIDLLPGETMTLSFTPGDPARLDEAMQSLVIRDLHSSSSSKRD